MKGVVPVEVSVRDEAAHPSVMLEWWFVFGWYEGTGTPRRYFVATLFRHGRGRQDQSCDRNVSYIGSVFDTASGRSTSVSRCDRAYHDALVARDPDSLSYNIDAEVLRTFQQELKASGPLRGEYGLESPRAEIRSDRLSAAWMDFSLNERDASFELELDEYGSGRPCRFRLVPMRSGHDVKALRGGRGADAGMAYNTYTRLELEGVCGGAAVSGLAWLDHQWGDPDEVVAEGGVSRIKGWDWFGIQLDNGDDWLVYVLNDAQTRSPLAQLALRSTGSNGAELFRECRLEPLEFWQSERTGIRWPVAWRVTIPAVTGTLEFRPLAADQEIPVYGVHRAVWEGVGEVSGSIAGQRVRGTARGEFHGYGYVFDAQRYFEQQAQVVTRHLEAFLPRTAQGQSLDAVPGTPEHALAPPAYDTMLARPTWELLDRGGKRWRPLFARYLLDSLGVAPQRYDRLIMVMAELCHSGALIIDDIEDGSALRRHAPCIHLTHGIDVAISAANTLYFLPLLLIEQQEGVTDAQRLKLHEIYARQMVNAHLGQAQDLFWSRHISPASIRRWLEEPPERILDAYALKTGAGLVGVAEMCAVMARADHRTRLVCQTFARSFSMVYQVLDDIHSFSGSQRWTKTRGEDIASGKWTYVLSCALRALAEAQRDRLAEIVGREELRCQSDAVDEAVELVQESAVLAQCRDWARTRARDAWEEVREVLEPCEARITLALLCRVLTDLEFE